MDETISPPKPELYIIEPNWDVPSHVHALTTQRRGGFSQGVYKGLNLGTHVGDELQRVKQNRNLVKQGLLLPTEPFWLNQTHSTDVIKLPSINLDADAAWTNKSNTVCSVLTADCLPVFFYHTTENSIAVAHAGWRGLLNGILENTVKQMTSDSSQLKVWLGPAIGATEFEVGEEVKKAFCKQDATLQDCFEYSKKDAIKTYYFADIYRLAKTRLYNAGVESIFGGDFCTVSSTDEDNHKRFYSYRRDGETGRMANLIWLSSK